MTPNSQKAAGVHLSCGELRHQLLGSGEFDDVDIRVVGVGVLGYEVRYAGANNHRNIGHKERVVVTQAVHATHFKSGGSTKDHSLGRDVAISVNARLLEVDVFHLLHLTKLFMINDGL